MGTNEYCPKNSGHDCSTRELFEPLWKVGNSKFEPSELAGENDSSFEKDFEGLSTYDRVCCIERLHLKPYR